jgi:hypothetical protein
MTLPAGDSVGAGLHPASVTATTRMPTSLVMNVMHTLMPHMPRRTVRRHSTGIRAAMPETSGVVVPRASG